jgi:protein phosphatase
MGSTMVVAAIAGSDMALLNVGDSPAYLIRNREARLISQDHSWPAEQVRLGVIKPEEAVDHPMKHRLTRAIGVWEQITVYTDKVRLKPGDQVVLCSDGVETAGVSVDEMRQMLSGEDLEAGVKRVIERCRERGAPDNITLAVARLEGAAEETTQVLTTRKIRPAARQGA